jgi:hypothetical protein
MQSRVTSLWSMSRFIAAAYADKEGMFTCNASMAIGESWCECPFGCLEVVPSFDGDFNGRGRKYVEDGSEREHRG